MDPAHIFGVRKIKGATEAAPARDVEEAVHLFPLNAAGKNILSEMSSAVLNGSGCGVSFLPAQKSTPTRNGPPMIIKNRSVNIVALLSIFNFNP